MNLIFFIKFFMIINFSKIYCGLYKNELDMDQVNVQWFPAIFRITRSGISKEEYEYKCLSVLIHHRAVLAAGSCVPVGMRDVTIVRFYNWKSNPKITNRTEYQERNLSKVIDFRSMYPGEVGTDHVHILELFEPMNQPPAVVVSVASYKYVENREWVTRDERRCVYVTTEGDITGGMNIKMTYITNVLKRDCCDLLNVATSDISAWWPEYAGTSVCGIRLFGITCYNIPDKKLFVHHDPMFCLNEYYNEYMQGFLVKINDNVVEFSNFEESRSWIKEFLNTLT